MESFALGLDYGTDSVRALLVNTASGEEVASSVKYFPRWAKGLYCHPPSNQFRQHPLDYLESLQQVCAELWRVAPPKASSKVVGISFDTTGSTPVAVDSEGQALALRDEFSENPNAMFVLWKDHTAIAEAQEITLAANAGETNYLKYSGGIYSSEWYWAKALHCMRNAPEICQALYMWVEHCDWMPAVLTGTNHPSKIRMGRCAAGHKLMWHSDWQGYPPNGFFLGLDPLLDGLCQRLPEQTFTSDKRVGGLTAEWAAKLGLPEGTSVGFGAFDCHMGAVAAKVAPGVLTKVIGTSTCDITVATYEDLSGQCIRGICGQVDGSVLPGMVGLEAGQSAFGDLYAWFRQILSWPLHNILANTSLLDPPLKSAVISELEEQILQKLGEEASQFAPGEVGLLATDWVNGRRTPDADQSLTMSISGLNMGSGAAQIFRSLVEATAFGALAIIERFREEGVPVNSVVALGGISKKSDFVMQLCADVWQCEVDVLQSDQSCALGAAIFASVVGGAHDSVEVAQQAMASELCKSYLPNKAHAEKYNELYQEYLSLGFAAEIFYG